MSDRRATILGPGPDGYEGFDRPGLGEDVPAEARAQARELTAATDILGLRRLATRLARNGFEGYDVVGLGQWAGAAWDFLGADVAVDGRSALIGKEDQRLNAHGLFSDPAATNAFVEEIGGGTVVLVWRLRRSAIRPGDRIWYTVGNEHNPSDPFGRVVLTIEADGSAELEHFSRAGGGAWTGRVDPAVSARIRSELARSSFPHVPREPIPAGSALRHLELVTDDEPEYAVMSAQQGERLDGFAQAFALLDAVAVRMSSGAYGGGKDVLEASDVSDVRPRT
jgi:hypothetical protein